MSWFSKMFSRAPEPPVRVEPSTKSFFLGESAFTSAAKTDSAFELLRGANGTAEYDRCPPLAIALNRLITATAGLDVHYYRNAEIVPDSRTTAILNKYKNSPDLAELIRSIQCAGRGFVVIVGNSDFMPSKISTIKPSDLGELEDANRNVYRIIVNGGRWQGTYEQIEYGSDVYRTADRLRTIIVIHNQSSPEPLSPVSAAIKTIVAGYNQNYRTIANGGRLNSVWSFKEPLQEPEIAARQAQASARVQKGGVTVTSGGDLDIKEFGLTAKDMDWFNQLTESAKEIYNLIGVPLPLVTNEASTFNNYATASAIFYEHKVLPFADYMFGIIGEYLAPLAKVQNAVMLADRENIDALQTKRLEQLKMRKEVAVETVNELRSSISGRGDIEGGDVLLVDARQVPITTATQEGNGI